MRQRWAPVGVFAALVALHGPLLWLPYFWDEAGYYVFAALDCFRHGWVIPRSTLANGHPPLLSLYLAAAWAVGGFHPLATRLGMLGWAAALVCGVYRLAATRLSRFAAILAAGMVALTPLVFAQSTLAQLDLPVAALVVWALVAGDGWGGAALLSAACLMKETAVIVPLTLLGWEAVRHRRFNPRWLAPVAVLGGWFLFYHHHTGYWFGNPQYFAYNLASTALSAPRILLALLRRSWQLAIYDGTGLLTLLALVAWWRTGRERSRVPRQWWAIIAAYLVFHAAVGGAVLARYLLPALALFYIALAEWLVRLPKPGLWAAGCAAWLVAGWFWNPPYPFPYEDNLAYAQFVRLHQAAARELAAIPLPGPIYTAWPATDELTRPELGYVTRPLAVHALPDFSPATLAGLSDPPRLLYLYSREYQPAHDWARWPVWRRWAERYFAYTPPAPPSAWLSRSGLRAEFRLAAGGQWVEVANARQITDRAKDNR